MRQTQLATFTGLLAIVVASVCNSIAIAGTFTVRGTFIADEPEGSVNNEPASPSPLEEAPVKVLIGDGNESTQSSSNVLVSGSMQNGEISLIGEIDAATIVTISVDVGLDAPLELDAVVAPGREVSFALLEWPTVLAFLGSVNSTTDTSQQFRIYGNLSAVKFDLKHATILARVLTRDTLGEVNVTNWHVLLKNNRFEIIGEITEPRVVNVFIYKGANYTQMQAVIEPGTEIELTTPSGSFKDIIASAPSGEGTHAKLIDSWQQTDEYWSAKRAYMVALNNYQKELLEQRAANVGSISQPSEMAALPNDDSTIEPDIANDENNECAQYADRRRNVQRQATTPTEVPEHVKALRKLNRLRLDPLENIAQQTEDPMDALLALDLGAFWGELERQTIYDRLAQTLDSETVNRRVIHDRNDHARYLSQLEKIFSLFVGTKAPEFALTSFKGSEVELYDVIENHQYVLLEFWASWCGPCIKALPGLKGMYAKRNSDQFEIVSVSIDRSRTMWEAASEKHEIPWINLVESDASNTKVSSTYGVDYVPKNYLLDSNGCIVQKDITAAQLERFLSIADDPG
ncbi:MAG: redoxin domain-containing protein [Gammaproteobacteria bacterium]|nr:redoxin domain-containing protein [Gammaproteobacteria bacterium]